MEKKNTTAATAAEEQTTFVEFSKPYHFEDKDYPNIDLAGLDNLTAEDMIAADKFMSRSGSFSIMPEMSMEYSCFIAAKATGLPIEFFKGLPPKEAIKVKNKVTAFFYGED